MNGKKKENRKDRYMIYLNIYRFTFCNAKL